ncbi:unnamed protein product [Eruca vesicaria subsp. sativa]|uniref:UBC core domain-containing protein n=1 Tax=Eruca vesicaria subsp. sativa TaxID=29727 RepID=A0ABC8KFB2_ERUVS|nr:unnamed protein product [Eruca vesicaria subsp. sativa]
MDCTYQETPYEGGVFQLAFAVPEPYPLQSLHVRQERYVFDILKNAWSPAWTLQSVCRAIIALN